NLLGASVCVDSLVVRAAPRSRRVTMIGAVGHTQVKWLGTSALIVGIGYGLVLDPVTAIEHANAQMSSSGTNIREVCEQSAYSLDELVECISEHMPGKGSGGYVLPSSGYQTAWRALVQDLVAITDISECDAIAVPTSLGGIYEVFSFYDAFDGREYCVAMEVRDHDDDG